MNILTKLCGFALFVTLWMPATAAARQPMGITMTGVIQSVDHSTRWIVFTQDGGPVRRFVYSEWAKFRHGHIDISPAHLKAGMRVQLSYHNPLFGPDYVSQIVLLDLLHEEGDSTHPLPSHKGS
ncbi:MAG: hypothetical protein Q8M07_29165 [Prosthecobacter sp.]|nr:hypothetical protein [Prosthecobacter sp.]